MAHRAVLAAVALLCGCSPYGGGEFACTTDSQCGVDGKCSDGFCSFPDVSCDSGFRYGELSGPLSNTCVGAQSGVDGGMDVPDMTGDHCYGGGLVKPCFATAPTGSVTLSNLIDTDTDNRCAATTNNIAACVIAAESITVNAQTFAAAGGMKPLVLVATQTISVSGALTVASSRMFNAVGAGADMPGCNTGTAPAGNSGGAGGSFGGPGGAGAAVGGAAGMPGGTLTVTALRGGCSGQTGGDAAAPAGPGARGRGGGAIYLIAEQSISVMAGGSINASGSGAGGAATGTSSGGGGGGSGGFIGLDSPSLMIAGSVFANGGGGGEASGAQSTGSPGGDALNATTPALGGGGSSSFGTDGGDGSVGGTLAGEAGAASCTGICTTPAAGGGGGGGAGIIKLYRAGSPSGGGPISPPAS